MIGIAVISFREFLEAFLLIGIFFGINKKFQLGRQKEIVTASSIGIVLSMLLPIIVFWVARSVGHLFTEKNADTIEGLLLTCSGLLIALVIFSLHKMILHGKNRVIDNMKQKMEQHIFDVSLFFLLIFFIVREGCEVAILVASTAFFSLFSTNLIGLFIGFFAAGILGLLVAFSYLEIPIRHVFTYTEYIIIVIGSAMIKNGMSILLANYFNIHTENIISFQLAFLPNSSTILGHVFNNIFGLTRQSSLLQLAIMGAYMIGVWYLFLVDKSSSHVYEKKATSHKR